ncbi:MAG: Fe-S cluster assembly protein SufD [Flavobacteriales bacterium]|nr:Fe-S cluster assembly protein SufD [Flavobacteriales bacterium]
MEVLQETKDMTAKEQFLSHFDTQDFSFDESFSIEKREEAKKIIEDLSFPTSKDEYWKYTRTNRIVKGKYSISIPENEMELDLAIPSKNCIVLVNGYYSPELSFIESAEGILFSSLSKAKSSNEMVQKHFGSLTKKDEIFAMINTAYHQDGAVLHLGKNVQANEVYYIINLIDDDHILSNPRNFIFMEQGSNAKVVLKTINSSNTGTFTNMVTEVFVEKNAQLEINKVQDESESSFQIATEQIVQANDSTFKINTFTLSGNIVRNNLNIDSLGKNTMTYLNGLYPLKGKQHVDNHSYLLHREPNCESHELYKGILNDQSTGVFNGKVFVHREAQKTNAFQSNANIVMSDTATINSKPELEIYADDVKCSHGSTTGQLDDEALFYLRARGLSKESARAVLVNAFASDVIEQIGVEAIKDEIKQFIDDNYQGIK